MRARPRLGALGLRGRIVGAVLVTTVATLGVAAVALFGPLQASLRNTAKNALKLQISQPKATASFSKLALEEVAEALSLPSNATATSERNAVLSRQLQLQTRLGAYSVTLLGYFSPNGTGYVIAPTHDSNVPDPDTEADVAAAYVTKKPQYGFTSIDGADYARAAVPLKIARSWYVLAVLKPINDISSAVQTVQRWFLYAALAGLLLTVIIGIPLAGTLVRRLRQLRQAAVQFALGEPVALPVDRARDEVGDLARTFEIMQRRLRQQEEARRAFVATASHELRTPLTSLDGMLELLDDDLQGSDPDLEDARSLLERARVQSRRLGRLAADLLDLSRIDAAVALRSEPVELGELSRAVLAEFELGTAERGIGSELDEHSGPVWALGDPGSVARIIRILLDNAVRASPPGSEIHIQVSNGDKVELSVSDEGPGVSVEERKLIFERFKRGRDTGSGAGFGLGLAIGSELAARMGGELTLDENYERGARFTLSLPAARAPDQDPVAIA
ncbi:MAG TPA: HAMP domain-containing sensor histidine kinase [Solirubrobacteraceae bacterium]|nr:HAMP domain-containing sensor histidine kinase [Solirubrobacteraceae bacterium]